MRKLLVELADSFRETFVGIWLWTAMCGLAILPFPGIILGFLIVGVVKLVLTALYLNPLAEWLCQSLSEGNSYYSQIEALPLDIIRIWVISYILISVISFVSWLPYRKNTR